MEEYTFLLIIGFNSGDDYLKTVKQQEFYSLYNFGYRFYVRKHTYILNLPHFIPDKFVITESCIMRVHKPTIK